jgi:hypothetical protein
MLLLQRLTRLHHQSLMMPVVAMQRVEAVCLSLALLASGANVLRAHMQCSTAAAICVPVLLTQLAALAEDQAS